MAGIADRQIKDALAALGSPAEPPAAGVAAALSGAVAASLVELASGLAAKRLGEDQEHPDPDGAARMRSLSVDAGELRERLLEAADEDPETYSKVAAADDAEGRAAALAAAADPPLVIAECAAQVAQAATETAASARDRAFGADAVVAAELALAATRSVARLVEANLGSDSDDPRTARARQAVDRASGAVAAVDD